MEMEGRGFSELLRSTTEEILIKGLVDNPIGNAVPDMEMLGFNNFMQPFSADSLELINGWLMNGESPASGITHRTRQASMRMPADLGLSQQNAVSLTMKNSDVHTSLQNFIASDEHLSHPDQYSLRNQVEDGSQASDYYFSKAGFPQPLKRCRPSELRSKYATLQDTQVKVVPQAPHNMPAHGGHRIEKDFMNMSNFFNIPVAERPNKLQKLMSPFSSSTSFKPSITTADTISSVVSMLEGSLEPENFDGNVDKETFDERSYGALTSQEAPCSIRPVFHILSPVNVPASGSSAKIERTLELSMKGFRAEMNDIQMRTISPEPSRNDSSTAAAALSLGFDIRGGSPRSRPSLTTCSNSIKKVGCGFSDLETRDKESRERMLENHFKDSSKKESLAWMDSVSSVGKADSTKKRRVERSRKMAEAKERNLTPSLSSDMQGILKRWENLEKEVRSLKLNLSFMNRKDSEQTKQIEELQKLNDALTKEKERLLEEREQNIP